MAKTGSTQDLINAGFNKPFTYPIVGISFHAPATKILKALPLNTRLELLAEPTNRVDPNAIAVNFLWDWIDTRAAARIELEIKSEPLDLQEKFLQSDFWHLGYLPATVAKYLKQEKDFPLDPIEALLVFPETKRSGNQPHVRFML